VKTTTPPTGRVDKFCSVSQAMVSDDLDSPYLMPPRYAKGKLASPQASPASPITFSKYGRPISQIYPTAGIIIANDNSCKESDLDNPIPGNRTNRSGKTKVRTAISTLANAGKGLFLSSKNSLNIDDIICLIEHESKRYTSKKRAYATNSNRIMVGPPSTHDRGRYFIGKPTSYGAFINDPLDENKYNARFRWNNKIQRWEVIAIKEIHFLDEIFISYGRKYWTYFQHTLKDKTQLFKRWPTLRSNLPTISKANLPQLSKSQIKHLNEFEDVTQPQTVRLR
jgi:hypothetical protein